VPHNVPGVQRDNIRGTDPVCVCWTPPRGQGTGGNLPTTGGDVDGLLLAAGALVAAGALASLGSRRRRPKGTGVR
jgi:LPXTG-motif cell wall-anchored protein